MTIFGALEIGKSAIMVNQTALNVTGHNVSNANTPGYTRQVANIVSSNPYSDGSKFGQLGTGADIASINRIRDTFTDARYRSENTSDGYWNAMQDSLNQIETVINEPSTNGLSSVLDSFWQSWQDLSSNPEDSSARAVVAQRGAEVADAFNQTYSQLEQMRQDVNANVKIKVDEINSYGQQIADLNQQILAINISGQKANDLEDKRDLLLDELSKDINVEIHTDANDMVTLQIGGRSLVQGNQFNKLNVEQDSQGMYMVIWDDTKAKADISGGALMGYLDIRGATDLAGEKDPSEYKETIPDLINQLNTLAKTLITTTNQLHEQGYSLNNKGTSPDNTDFFQMPDGNTDSVLNWAKLIKENTLISSDPKNIAASGVATYDTSGNETNFGNGTIALQIAQLKQNTNTDDPSVSTGDIASVDDAPISLSVKYGDKVYKVQIASPTNTYVGVDQRANVIANAINQALGENVVSVQAEGNSIVFSSSDYKFKGISDLSINSVDYGDFSVLKVKGASVDDFWSSVCGDIGVLSQGAQRMAENQDTLVTQLDNQRQTVSGVSLDEELTNMIKYQHSYNAAARFITTIDSTIDTIINRMGLVGRS